MQRTNNDCVYVSADKDDLANREYEPAYMAILSAYQNYKGHLSFRSFKEVCRHETGKGYSYVDRHCRKFVECGVVSMEDGVIHNPINAQRAEGGEEALKVFIEIDMDTFQWLLDQKNERLFKTYVCLRGLWEYSKSRKDGRKPYFYYSGKNGLSARLGYNPNSQTVIGSLKENVALLERVGIISTSTDRIVLGNEANLTKVIVLDTVRPYDEHLAKDMEEYRREKEAAPKKVVEAPRPQEKVAFGKPFKRQIEDFHF